MKLPTKCDDFLLRDIERKLDKIKGMIAFKMGSKAYTEDGELISSEQDWYENLEEWTKTLTMMDIMEEAKYEFVEGEERLTIYEKGREHRAYQAALDGIEVRKKKLKATGKVIEADL